MPGSQSSEASALSTMERRSGLPRSLEELVLRCIVHRVNALIFFASLAACDAPSAFISPNRAPASSSVETSAVFSGAPIALQIGETIQLPDAPKTFRDTRKVGMSASFRSVDLNVASVTAQGVVQGTGDGATLILHIRPDVAIDTFVVRIGSGPRELRFSVDTLRLGQIGASQLIQPTENRYRPQARSNNTSVAMVSPAGVVSARSNGLAVIEVVDLTGASGRLPVVVGGSAALSFGVHSVALFAGDMASFPVSGANGETVTYVSHNPLIAAVRQDGTVEAKSVGQTEIVASAFGARPDTLLVTVESRPAQPTSLSINASVSRRNSRVGTVLVSNAIPLPQGLLRAGESRKVRVLVGGVEQRIFVEELSGRHQDGSLRSVLVQFPFDPPTTGGIAAQIVVGQTGRSGVDIPKQEGDRGNPDAVILPTDPAYLVSTDLVGPTLTMAETFIRFGALGKRYDEDFAKFADLLLINYGDGWMENYYDRAQAYYAMWVRSGNPIYWSRGTQHLLNYRKGYLEQSNYGTSPHWSQMDGLGLHYLLTGDEQSRYAITRVTTTLWYFRVRVGLGTKTSADIENRIRARVLMAHLWAWRLSDSPATLAAELESAYTAVLSAQESDGSYRFTAYCNQSLNYMDGMLNEALIQIYQLFREDSRILTAVEKNTNWLWSQWVPTAQGFKYLPAACTGVGDTAPVPELNSLIVNGYAWVYTKTRSNTAATRADAIFKGSVEKSFLYGSKQFNQQYSTSWRYFAYRSQ